MQAATPAAIPRLICTAREGSYDFSKHLSESKTLLHARMHVLGGFDEDSSGASSLAYLRSTVVYMHRIV